MFFITVEMIVLSFAQLLNTTVAAMAISVNAVLTCCYHACFGESSGSTEQDELMLVTAPLSAASEVQGLFEKGIIDAESAIPAALHSLGCSSNEITEALRRMRDQKDSRGNSEKETSQIDTQVKQAQAAHTYAGIPLIKAQVKKIEADTALSVANAKKDADSPPPPAPSEAVANAAAAEVDDH